MSDLKHNLEDYIDLGYQWIEKIEEEYKNPPNGGVGDVLSKYYRLVGEWEEQVKRILPNAARKRAFALAKSSDPTYESGKSVGLQNLIKNIRAKIAVLEEYRKEEASRLSFDLSGPQSRVNINSPDSSVNVITGEFISVVNQLELEFEQNYQEEDKKELLKLLDELKGKQIENKRAGEILGILLTRGAEIAQIGSLVAQLLSMLFK